MKKFCVSVLSLVTVFASCESSKDFNGAWALKETYDYWKTGKSEEVVATESKIGNAIYLVLTNSIVIGSQENPAFFSVPGGRWKLLGINRETSSKYLMELESTRMNDATANLSINILPDSLIYFEVKDMTNDFKSEFDQSFLMLGDKHPYIRCERQK